MGFLLSGFSTNRCSGLMLWCLGLWCVVSLFSLIVQLLVLGLKKAHELMGDRRAPCGTIGGDEKKMMEGMSAFHNE